MSFGAATAEARKLQERRGGTIVVAVCNRERGEIAVDVGVCGEGGLYAAVDVERVLMTLTHGAIQQVLESPCSSCPACVGRLGRLRRIFAILGEGVGSPTNMPEGSATQ